MSWALIVGLASALEGALDPQMRPARDYIGVYGEAEERVAADVATLKLALKFESASAPESFEDEPKAMAELQAALAATGVATQDMRTLGPMANAVRPPGSAPSAPKWLARGVLSVEVRSLDRLGEIVAGAQAHGADVQGLRYDTSSRNAREDALRAAAVADARHKAETYADAAGMKLGPVHIVIEEGANQRASATQYPQRNEVFDAASGDAGAIFLREGVYMAFELAPK